MFSLFYLFWISYFDLLLYRTILHLNAQKYHSFIFNKKICKFNIVCLFTVLILYYYIHLKPRNKLNLNERYYIKILYKDLKEDWKWKIGNNTFISFCSKKYLYLQILIPTMRVYIWNNWRFLINIFSWLINTTSWILREYLIHIRFFNKRNYIS